MLKQHYIIKALQECLHTEISNKHSSMHTFPLLGDDLLLRALFSRVPRARVPAESTSLVQGVVYVSTCHSDALYDQSRP